MHTVLHARAPFLLKMVLCVNFMARCTLFIHEKCYGRVFRIGANALVSNAPGRVAQRHRIRPGARNPFDP
jgi:hypothetical protein